MEKQERKFLMVITTFMLMCYAGISQNDLPNPNPNLKWVPQGSLVIGTDNVTQADLSGRYNLKVYGLINALLQASIPVKWCIKTGKIKDGIDIIGYAELVSPAISSPQFYEFRSGPFIIDSTHHDTAMVIVNSFANDVHVYRLINGVESDIRYTLAFKPNIAILSNGGNQNIHLDYLNQAGIITVTGNDSSGTRTYNEPWVTVIPANLVINWGGCYTFASEAHWDTSNDTVHTFAIYRFLQNGSNFLAQCEGVQTYENDDTLASTNGIDVANASFSYSFFNPDMPFLQIHGDLSNIGGSLRNWINNNGNYRPNSYLQVGSFDQTYQVARALKLLPNDSIGGNAFYLGGHDYGSGWRIDRVNGRRMYLNAVFVPAEPKGACAQTVFPLPISLLSFEGVRNNQTIQLNWVTTSEINNAFFQVEHSIDGIHFKSIASVEGHGTTSSINNYSIDHLSPHVGLNYYRLNQFDFDDKNSFSEIIAIRFNEDDVGIKIEPNPAKTEISIQFQGIESGRYVITLYDVKGNYCGEEAYELGEHANSKMIKFNIKSLPSGYYTLRVTNHKNVFYSKFIKS